MLISQATANLTRDWLKRNPGERFSPILFFGRAWSKHKIVVVGERHDEAPHRDFVALMVKHWGGPQVGLALEIDAGYQAGIDAHLKEGTPLPDGWFSNQARYRPIFAAARETETAVVAMDASPPEKKPAGDLFVPKASFGRADGSARVDRNQRMAVSVLKLAEGKSNVLVFAGMKHAAEAVVREGPAMGARLVKEYGSRVYTICTMTRAGHGQEPFFLALKSEFGREGAIAFDLDRSPLARELVTDEVSVPWSSYADGVMVFFGA